MNLNIAEKHIAKKKRWQLFKQVLSIAADTADILVHVAAKPGVLGLLSIGFKIINSYENLKKDNVREVANIFVEMDWREVQVGDFQNYIFDILRRSAPQEMLAEEEDGKRYHIIFDIDGIKIGFIRIDENEVQGPYTEKNNVDTVLPKLGEYIWEYMENDHVFLKSTTGSKGYDWNPQVSFVADDLDSNVFKSQVATDILEMSEKFISKGYNRSIMLYGSPGTGKSSAMKFIAKNINERSLRIGIGDLSLSSNSLLVAIEMLRPGVLMIDDFDRSFKHDQLLSELEQFNEKIKLFMVSVNDVSKIPPAVIRPRRFDDLIEIEHLDKEIVDRLIGDETPKPVRERLHKLPIAYINEFHKRKVVLGLNAAISSVEELSQRMSRFKSKSEDDDPVVLMDDDLLADPPIIK